MPSMKPSNSLFEANFRLDLADERGLKKMYSDDLVRELMGSSEALKEVRREEERVDGVMGMDYRLRPNGSNCKRIENYSE